MKLRLDIDFNSDQLEHSSQEDRDKVLLSKHLDIGICMVRIEEVLNEQLSTIGSGFYVAGISITPKVLEYGH